MRNMTGLLLAIIMMCSAPLQARTSAETGAPEALRAWEAWVLYGHEEQYLCPSTDSPQCLWPVRLSLDLTDEGGRFTQSLDLKVERGVPLPGGLGAWPDTVSTAQTGRLPVLGRAEPEVHLPAGSHILQGTFDWPELPETITVPLGYILEVKVNGQTLDFPAMEMDYDHNTARLWLRKSRDPAEIEAVDSLTVTVNRFIDDSQPMMITSRFILKVGGRPREILLPNALLPDTKIVRLISPLPAQLTPDGLRVRVKAGVHEIVAASRALGRSESLGPVPESSETEYWAFQARPELRSVQISGAPQIDPSQADIYPPWRNFPIYVMKPGDALIFETIRRGDPEPAPDQLRLERQCWLDYDGGGLTCRDHLTGVMSRQWHLNVSQPFTLTQATLGGQPQVITWQTDSRGRQAPGVQVRQQRLNLRADLRIDDFTGVIPASGWDHKLETKGQRINLPPGYRLLHVSGVDDTGYSTAWTGSWVTMDFFIILIITIAFGKLFGRSAGILALAALVLCYHEPGAPRLIFLPLLACAALLKLLPPQHSKIRWLVGAVRNISTVLLVLLAGLFLIGQARAVIYPQLEPSGYGFIPSLPIFGASPARDYAEYDGMAADESYYYRTDSSHDIDVNRAETAAEMPELRKSAVKPQAASAGKLTMSAPQSSQSGAGNVMVNLSQAPDAKVQNSAPRPAWVWRVATLYFNESVTADQEVKLFLAGPTANRIWGLARIALMTLLTLMFLNVRRRNADRSGPDAAPETAPAAAAVLAALSALLIPAAPALADDYNAKGENLAAIQIRPYQTWPGHAFPSREMLDEYRERLLSDKPMPPASITSVRLSTEAEGLTLEFHVSVGRAEEIVHLPAFDRNIFRPERVFMSQTSDSGSERDLPLLESRGQWITVAPQGIHTIIVKGRLKKITSTFQAFQINFPPQGRPKKVEVIENPLWLVEGVDRDGQLMASQTLHLTAQKRDGLETPADEPDDNASLIIDPFFEVSRTLSLGLQWQVHTTVRRITPAGAPASLRLPLLPGENPIGGFRRDGASVTVDFDPQSLEVSWASNLDIGPELQLTAAEGPWTETWLLDASPIWRIKHSGLLPVHNLSGGFWQPQWRPWPGESLTLMIDRPQAVPGLHLVIDQASLSVAAGENNQLAELNFKVRTSQGGPFSFRLPREVEVRSFFVDGRAEPITPAEPDLYEDKPEAEPGNAAPVLTAHLTAGEHDITVSWTSDETLGLVTRTPALDLGAPTANIRISLTMPENRWILWTWGPLQGPAVQFWPLLAVVLLAAFILSRCKSTPLGVVSWFLLGVGLIQLNIVGAMIVAGWLLMLGYRKNHPVEGAFKFNFLQIVLTLWTFVALLLIYKGIEHGLLRNPDMLISGGGSYGQRLNWFIDRSVGQGTEALWPSGAALSVAAWFYKALMLAWSLWMAVALVKWLRWAWQSFSCGALWKKRPPKTKPQAGDAASTAEASAAPTDTV